MKTIEELLRDPYWVVDALPEQVKADSDGQYFAVERYYLEPARFAELKQKHIDVVLKLNCYMRLFLDEEDRPNPPPAEIAERMRRDHLCIRIGGALIVSEPDDACMTVYNADETLLSLLRPLAAAEGLFVWQP